MSPCEIVSSAKPDAVVATRRGRVTCWSRCSLQEASSSKSIRCIFGKVCDATCECGVSGEVSCCVHLWDHISCMYDKSD